MALQDNGLKPNLESCNFVASLGLLKTLVFSPLSPQPIENLHEYLVFVQAPPPPLLLNVTDYSQPPIC